MALATLDRHPGAVPCLRELHAAIAADARDWCPGRAWLPRLGLLLYLGYAGVRQLTDATYASWFGGITFGIHELAPQRAKRPADSRVEVSSAGPPGSGSQRR